jgi:hypothetical protein
MDKIPLSEMLIELSRELEEARLEGEKTNLHFRVESIDVELQVTVSKEAGIGAKFKFWVIDGDARARIAGESLQKLRLKLNPHAVGEGGSAEPLDIDDERSLGTPDRSG